MIKHYIDETII